MNSYKMNNNDLRKAWLDYYSKNGFKIISGAPLVHPAFPLSFNMSAGLVQLDPKIRVSHKVEPYKECLIQKCVRYFDVDKVGDDTHLSFFEMAGAFELGEFDEEKIVLDLWNFLVNGLKIEKEKLWATAFGKEKVVDRVISLPEHLMNKLKILFGEKLIIGNAENAFWKQGGGAVFTDNLRLCGPQVEFWYDLGERPCCRKNNCSPINNCGRFLEISNTVFIKYAIDMNQELKLIDLVNQASEAVIGLERVDFVLEKTSDIFHTSAFTPLLRKVGDNENMQDTRIVIDHIKALSFILAEEVIKPSNNGRGRQIRKLISHLTWALLSLQLNPAEVIPKLVEEVISTYHDFYPEINRARDNAIPLILEREASSRRALEKNIRRMKTYIEKNNLKQIGEKEKEYFKTNFGVPLKLQAL